MIQLPTKAQLKTLQVYKKPDSLSIYSPYIKPNSPDNNPNRTQLKNLLKEARQLLLSKKLSDRDIDELFKPVQKLLDGDEFRQDSKNSLALFISRDFFQYYHLPPKSVAVSVSINDGFNLQPILGVSQKNLPYFVLILSHNGARLLRGDKYSIEPIETYGTMKQDLNIDEYPKGFQPHRVAPVIEGKGSNKFHGQYNESQVDKDMLAKFFTHIDSKMNKIMKKEKIPLIIAGVDYLLPLYRQANTYPRLLDSELQGNFEHTPPETIRKRACRLVDAQ